MALLNMRPKPSSTFFTLARKEKTNNLKTLAEVPRSILKSFAIFFFGILTFRKVNVMHWRFSIEGIVGGGQETKAGNTV